MGVGLWLCGLEMVGVAFDVGVCLAGMGMILLAWWLLYHDLARRRAAGRGFPISRLWVLHLSLLLRVGGDLAGWWPGRSWGGLLNGVALGLFLVNTGYAIWSGADHTRTPEEAA